MKSSAQLFNLALSKVITGDASVLAVAGTTPSTIAINRINLSLGGVLVGGQYLNQAALTDQILLGTGNWAKSFKLDGTAAVVLSANGKTYWCALVAVLINSVPALCAVYGNEAADTFEVAPTSDQIVSALRTALGATYSDEFGVVLSRFKVQRAGGVITETFTDPAANDALKSERLAGTLTQ